MQTLWRMVATCWYDSKLVYILSTLADLMAKGACSMYWVDGIRRAIISMSQHVEYQNHMHSVNVVDQMRTDYSVQFHSHKWWHKYLLSLWIVGSTICRCYSNMTSWLVRRRYTTRDYYTTWWWHRAWLVHSWTNHPHVGWNVFAIQQWSITASLDLGCGGSALSTNKRPDLGAPLIEACRYAWTGTSWRSTLSWSGHFVLLA